MFYSQTIRNDKFVLTLDPFVNLINSCFEEIILLALFRDVENELLDQLHVLGPNKFGNNGT